MYQVPHIINAVLYRAKFEGIPIDRLKLIKLLYMIYKEYLIVTNDILFAERFVPADRGPSLFSVEHAYPGNDEQVIKKYAPDAEGHLVMVKPETLEDLRDPFNAAWDRYKNCQGLTLSKFTHEADTAWSKARKANARFLDDQDIITERAFVA